MRASRRKILLFIDNCPAHHTTLGFLTNIRVEFLPKNTTSKLQPCDQGIIRNLKHYYRQKLVRRLLLAIDIGRPLEKDVFINLLQAMHFLMVSYGTYFWVPNFLLDLLIIRFFFAVGVGSGETPDNCELL